MKWFKKLEIFTHTKIVYLFFNVVCCWQFTSFSN